MPRSPIGFVLLTRTGNVYVMDEPITGLHPADIDRLPSAFTFPRLTTSWTFPQVRLPAPPAAP